MPDSAIDWVVVRDFKNREIGAIGFIQNKAAVIAAFYDDRDANMDGKVELGEWIVSTFSPISLKNRAVTEVAMTARYDDDILERDASFPIYAANMYLHFARGLIADGFYTVYLSRAVSAVAKPIAGRITSNIVKQFVIRKGMERSVKAIYDATVEH